MRFAANRWLAKDPKLYRDWSEKSVITNNEQVYLSGLAFDKSGVQSIDYTAIPTQYKCVGHDFCEMNFSPAPARSWMARCLKNHNACNNAERWCPERLLFIGDKDTPELRLIFPDQKQCIPYATVSHRWPQSPINCTILSFANLNAFQVQIYWDTLHSPFKVAIDIVRDLNISHIWIDSLCIIRDAPLEEKQSDIRAMDNIYFKALVNISAASASNGTEPIILQRCSKTLTHPMFVTKNGLRVAYEANRQAEMEICPLNNRGWVLQENLLANRVLHVSDYGMIWQCQESIGNDRNPNVWGFYPGLRSMIQTGASSRVHGLVSLKTSQAARSPVVQTLLRLKRHRVAYK